MNPNLARLGFSPFFSQQLDADESKTGVLARVVQVQRSGLVLSDGEEEFALELGGNWFRKSAEARPTVGDWLVLDETHKKIQRLLARKSVFKRVAAGTTVEIQLIAANIDTLFIVLSCNEDFKESRLERYLALALEAGVDPVVILTKADLVDDYDSYRDRVAAVRADLPLEVVNALDVESLRGATAWVSPGATVALVGSSGVGKSTIVNSLAGKSLMDTAGIREKDSKGRHTTSFRSLHRLDNGGLLLDVPGMRELKVAELGDALEDVFNDIGALSSECRFSDCAHGDEPGCAVRAAIEAGQLDERRLVNYHKLQREDARHNTTIAEKRKKDRAFGRIVREAVNLKRRGSE